MPDWITHILVAWSLFTIIGFRYKFFNPANSAIFILGALIPDLVKISIPLQYFGIPLTQFLLSVHMPSGALLMASILSFLFKEQKTALILLISGMIVHFAIDSLLLDLNGGIYLLYPLSWNQYQLGLITNYNINVTLLSATVALIVFLLSYKIHKKKIPVES